MKILLVWPRDINRSSTLPLAYAYLVNQIDREKHTVRLLDCALDNIPAARPRFSKEVEEFQPDLVGFSCWSCSVSEVIDGLKAVRKVTPSAVTIVGGVHPSLFPEMLTRVPEIDFIFCGETITAFTRFLEELELQSRRWEMIPGLGFRAAGGETVINEKEEIRDLDDQPLPDYGFIKLHEYQRSGYKPFTSSRRSAPILATRGCPYRCQFCSVPQYLGPGFKHHSLDYLVKLITTLHYQYGVDYINIMDNSFTQDLDFAKEFCRKMISLDLPVKFTTGRGIRMEQTDRELFRLMKEAGWDAITFAGESGSNRVLENMQKGIDSALILEKVAQVRETGLKVFAYFMYGYPDETEEDIARTLKLIRDCRPDFFHLFRFNPLPGTPVYDELQARGDLPSEDGSVPVDFARGDSPYVPHTLSNFNFRGTLLKAYLRLFITHPAGIYYFFKNVGGPATVIKHFVLRIILGRAPLA